MIMTEMIKHKTGNQGRGMRRFEKFQIVFLALQTAIFLASLVAAVWIGVRQNQINGQLLDLNFRLSLEITYDKGRLNVFNKGRENVWLWGSQFGDYPMDIGETARLIVPGGHYYILTDRLQAIMHKRIGTNTDSFFPWNIFIATENGRRYIAKTLLLVKIVGGEMTVHTQTLGFVEADWGKQANRQENHKISP
jgi:hypothetical protein